QDTDADREEKLAGLAFDSIRAGRDGSEQSPFEVLRVADECDVLSSSGLRSTGQELRPTAYRGAHVPTLAGGGELWFRLLWRDAPPACAPRGRAGAAGRAAPWGRRRASCVRPGSPVRSVSVLLDRHLVVAQQVVRG